MDARKVSRFLFVWRFVTILDPLVLLAGALGAVAGRRWGAYVLVGYLVVRLGLHLLVSVRAYREVMQRPWPHTWPLPDDDEDD